MLSNQLSPGKGLSHSQSAYPGHPWPQGVDTTVTNLNSIISPFSTFESVSYVPFHFYLYLQCKSSRKPHIQYIIYNTSSTQVVKK